MTELEQLRADLATIKAANEIYERDYRGCDAKAIIGIMEKKIAQLEAEAADPCQQSRETIEHWRKTGSMTVHVQHFDHLTAENERLAKRVAELEAEIKAEDDADIADAEKALAEMVQANQDMGLYEATGNPMAKAADPVLDPARVLATAETLGWARIVPNGTVIKPAYAKPYPLKGAENGS